MTTPPQMPPHHTPPLTESRKTRYTRATLQDALMELLARKPLAKISVKELCTRADVNRSTFYAHYANTEDLLGDIERSTLDWVGETLATVNRATMADDQEAIRQVLEQVCAYIRSNHNHLQVLMSPQADLGFQQDLIGLIYGFSGFRGVGQVDEDDADEDASMRFHFAVSGSIGLIQYWLSTDLAASSASVASTIYTMSVPSLAPALPRDPSRTR